MEQKNTPKYTKKQKWQIAAKITALCLIVAIIVSYMNDVFNYPNNHVYIRRYQTFLELEENSVDAVYIGSSVVDRSWIAAKAFNDYGMTVYPYASNKLHLTMPKFMIEEVLRTQDPDLFIIDISCYPSDPKLEYPASRVRRIVDHMPLTKNKLEAIQYARKYLEGAEGYEYDASWYLPFIKYHGRWDYMDNDIVPLTKADFENGTSRYMGAFTDKGKTGRITPQEYPTVVSDTLQIPETSEEILRDFLDYAKELENKTGKKFLFVKAPCALSEKEMSEFNYCFDIVDEYGFDYINFNTDKMYEKVGVDFDIHFYDKSHLNAVGAMNYTEYFSKYLKEKYDLPDHRGADNYENWQTAYYNYLELYDTLWDEDEKLLINQK